MANHYPSFARTYGAYDENFFMYTTLPAGAAQTYRFDTVAGNSAPVAVSYPIGGGTPNVKAWYSERIAANYTVQTTDAFSIQISAYWTTANPNATIRATLSRVTQSTGVETVIGSVDGATAKDNVINKEFHNFVIPTAVPLAAGEKLLLRLWAIPPSGQTFTTGELRYQLGSSSAGVGQAILGHPAGLTFLGYNQTKLYMRRTTAAAIGTFFDALLDPGPTQAAATGIVGTSNVSEKPWTRTSGGTALEWISPRCKDAWIFRHGPSALTRGILINVQAGESATTANAGFRLKVFRYRAGVETLCASLDYNVELASPSGTISLDDIGGTNTTNVTFNQTDFQIDDRVVVRPYLIPVGGTMPSGQTATVWYDTNVTASQLWVQVLDTVSFKAESDPAYVPPPGAPMVGMVGA